jgi:hypothetical protein
MRRRNVFLAAVLCMSLVGFESHGQEPAEGSEKSMHGTKEKPANSSQGKSAHGSKERNANSSKRKPAPGGKEKNASSKRKPARGDHAPVNTSAKNQKPCDTQTGIQELENLQ